MSKPILIIAVLIILTVLVGWQYFLPVFSKVSGLRGELKIWQAKLEDTQALSRKLESLKNKYNTMTDEAERVSQSIPKGEDLPGLLVQLEQLASQAGLILNSVNFTVPEVKKTKAPALTTQSGTSSVSPAAVSTKKNEAKKLSVEVSLSGTQDSLKYFLSSVEENLRIMDVMSFGLTSKGSLSELTMSQTFAVSLITYFR